MAKSKVLGFLLDLQAGDTTKNQGFTIAEPECVIPNWVSL